MKKKIAALAVSAIMALTCFASACATPGDANDGSDSQTGDVVQNGDDLVQVGGDDQTPSDPGQGGEEQNPSDPGQGGEEQDPSEPEQGGEEQNPSEPEQGGEEQNPSEPGQGGSTELPE